MKRVTAFFLRVAFLKVGFAREKRSYRLFLLRTNQWSNDPMSTKKTPANIEKRLSLCRSIASSPSSRRFLLDYRSRFVADLHSHGGTA